MFDYDIMMTLALVAITVFGLFFFEG